MTRGKGKSKEDECIDQVQSEVQRGRVPTYIGGASPINDRDVYVRKWEVISNSEPMGCRWDRARGYGYTDPVVCVSQGM